MSNHLSHEHAINLLQGWLTAIKQQNKAIKRKNKLIRRLRNEMSKMESTVERYLDNEIKKLGGDTYKFTSPGKKNVPDRIVMCQCKLIFVEMKSIGEKPTSGQQREIDRINDRYKNVDNISAIWIEGKKGVDEFINREFKT